MISLSLRGFEPVELGLPGRFPEFRPIQLDAIEEAYNDPRRFQGLALPTGAGKTLIALAIARTMGVRAAILTSTLGLQAQYLKDFEQSGLFDIRGKNNYRCVKYPRANCRFGPTEGCARKDTCTYELERAHAKESQLVLTNYSYWLRVNERARGLERSISDRANGALESNPFELLILDEAHRAMEELGKSLSMTIRESWLRHIGSVVPWPKNDDLIEWQEFAFRTIKGTEEALKEAVAEYRKRATVPRKQKIHELEELLESLTRIGTMHSPDWICEMTLGTAYGRVWKFDPIWPAKWAEQRLFLGIPKVVLMSATLRPASLSMLGISREQSNFREWPRIFPPQLTPVYHLRTVRLNHRATTEDLDKWVAQIDSIIEARLDRKGLIHTVSYPRQKYLREHSRFAHLMLTNTQDPDSPKVQEVADEFRSLNPPSVLVSPSFSTGWDFPGAQCEYVIIAKLPFPDTRSPLMKARVLKNPKYGDHLAMQDLVQACFRGSRHEKDRCEVFIVDDSIKWFMQHNRNHAPRWFEIITIDKIPPAPLKLAA